MEKREYPRKDVSGTPLKASVVINGGSLINQNSPHAVEIQAQPVNLSRSGICLTLKIDAEWQTIMPQKEITIILENGDEKQYLKAEVVRIYPNNHMMIGFKFPLPFPNMESFLMPEELISYN